MYIVPSRPFMTVLLNIAASLGVSEALLRGILKVNVINTSFAVTPSGTFNVTVNGWTATGNVNTVQVIDASSRSRDTELMNLNFSATFTSGRAVV